MDPITIVGIVGGFTAAIVAAMWEGTHLEALFEPSALFLILMGTGCATMACFSLDELKELFSSARMALKKPNFNLVQLCEVLGDMASKARRDGLLVLESYPIEMDSPLLKRGIQLIVDGTDPALVKDLLLTEVATREARLKGQGSIFSTAGGFAPTLGIIGTVIGLVHVLGNLSEPDKLGPAIAVAFIATLYGIAFANLLFLPLGKKMTFVAKQDAEMSIAIVEGVLSIQAGENPRVVQEKIRSFMKEEEWREIAAKLEAK